MDIEISLGGICDHSIGGQCSKRKSLFDLKDVQTSCDIYAGDINLHLDGYLVEVVCGVFTSHTSVRFLCL